MKLVPLNEVKDELSKYLRLAESEDVVITRHGQPAGFLVGFEDEEDWLDYQILHDPEFQSRMRQSLQDVREGRLIPFEELKLERSQPSMTYRVDDKRKKANRVADRADGDVRSVTLDPDVAQVFTSSEAVNAVLRALIATMPR